MASETLIKHTLVSEVPKNWARAVGVEDLIYLLLKFLAAVLGVAILIGGPILVIALTVTNLSR